MVDSDGQRDDEESDEDQEVRPFQVRLHCTDLDGSLPIAQCRYDAIFINYNLKVVTSEARSFFHSRISFKDLYSTPSRKLLRGAPDSSAVHWMA